MSRRVLVAGIGNIFLGDDGFGPEVLRHLRAQGAGDSSMVDYGIRGMHLAYDLLDPWDQLILVDAVPSRGSPGTVHVFEVGPDEVAALQAGASGFDAPRFDAHGMDPAAVLGNLDALGGTLPPTVVVGCEASNTDERIGLTPAVAAAVPRAAEAVRELLRGR